jgi:hypothetical protein
LRRAIDVDNGAIGLVSDRHILVNERQELLHAGIVLPLWIGGILQIAG